MVKTIYQTAEVAGEVRSFCLQPREYPVGDLRCCAGMSATPYTREEILAGGDVDLSSYVVRISNHGQHNLCWAFGATGAFETAWHLAGNRPTKFSPGWLVGNSNGGVDEGESIDITLEALMKVGMVPNSVIPDLAYSPRQWQQNPAADAAKHRLLKSYDCGHQNTVLAMLSELRRRRPVVFGMVGPFPGPHCVYATGYRIVDGRIRLNGANSWGTSYTGWEGHPGFWECDEGHMTYLTRFGAWSIEAVLPDPDDLPPKID